jgi:hypothetical protein
MAKPGTTLAITSNWNTLRRITVIANVVPSSLIISTLMVDAICSSETSVLIRVTRHHIPEDAILYLSFLQLHRPCHDCGFCKQAWRPVGTIVTFQHVSRARHVRLTAPCFRFLVWIPM